MSAITATLISWLCLLGAHEADAQGHTPGPGGLTGLLVGEEKAQSSGGHPTLRKLPDITVQRTAGKHIRKEGSVGQVPQGDRRDARAKRQALGLGPLTGFSLRTGSGRWRGQNRRGKCSKGSQNYLSEKRLSLYKFLRPFFTLDNVHLGSQRRSSIPTDHFSVRHASLSFSPTVP